MRKSRYSSEQIAYALKQAEAGVPITEVCRKCGISQQTFYRWRSKYGELLADGIRTEDDMADGVLVKVRGEKVLLRASPAA